MFHVYVVIRNTLFNSYPTIELALQAISISRGSLYLLI